MKKLVLVLGDQLKADSSAFNHFDAAKDEVIMIESEFEANYVWTHKAKIALFLSAMRHFAEVLKKKKLLAKDKLSRLYKEQYEQQQTVNFDRD